MSDYLAEELSRDDRARIERHVAECADCAQVLTTLETLIAELQDVRDAAGDATADVILQAVRRRLDTPQEQPQA